MHARSLVPHAAVQFTGKPGLNRTLMEAGKGGSESGALTSSPSTRPSASCRATASHPSGCVLARTMSWASGMLIILYADEGGILRVACVAAPTRVDGDVALETTRARVLAKLAVAELRQIAPLSRSHHPAHPASDQKKATSSVITQMACGAYASTSCLAG